MTLNVTDVQQKLKGADYPAEGAELAELAESNGADQELVEALAGMDRTLSGPDDVMHELKGSLTGSDN